MTATAPWSVKGIEPKAREIAKDLARRSGMTLGEWLNTMILDDEDDGVTPLPRRAHAAEAVDRRGRARRLDDAYESGSERDRGHDPAGDEVLHRVAASVDALAAKLEASERRATLAVQGVDQAVAGILARLDTADEAAQDQTRRIDDVIDELREGTRRLRAFEKETGPKTVEAFGKMETSIAAVTSRLYDIEERQRLSTVELRQRMEAAEADAKHLPAVLAAGDGVSALSARLDQAQAATGEALRNLQRSFAGLDARLGKAEEDDGRLALLAEGFRTQIEEARAEMLRRIEMPPADDGRIGRIERAVATIESRSAQAERRSAEAIDNMGREILRVAQNLNGRLSGIESQGHAQLTELGARMERDNSRLSQALEQRIHRGEDQHALALETFGTEIGRVSDRLTDRIGQSERRAGQAVEDIGRRLDEGLERSNQRLERSSSELAERLRQSEERTTRLLIEARDRLEARVASSTQAPAPVMAAPVKPAPTPVAAPAAAAPVPDAAPAVPQPAPSLENDWRVAAFPGADFPVEDDGWVQAPLPEPAEPSQDQPRPAISPTVTSPAPALASAPPSNGEAAVQPGFGRADPKAFGGADVSGALEALDEEFDDSSDFVDERALRAQMAQAAVEGRAASTRSAVSEARATMAAAPAPTAKSGGFNLGFRRGGKTKLLERLDKQAGGEGSTLKKALLASVIGAAAVGGIVSTARLIGGEPAVSGEAVEAEPVLAASAVVSEAPASAGEATALYENGLALLDVGDAAGLAPLTQAANLGHAPAQLKLVSLYQTGEQGVPQDSTESRVWARRAAEGGDARGMHAYAMYLYDGVGGAANRRDALTWLVKAANRGLVDSQFNAAKLYELGDLGVRADPVRALTWYLIAAQAGDGQARTSADRLSATMSALDRQAARDAAAAFSIAPAR